MFGLLGAALFGAICHGAWACDDRSETQRRINSKQSGSEFYFDKNGRMRHTENGRKYTQAEIHQTLFSNTLEDRNAEYDRKVADLRKKRFYCAKKDFRLHYFLTKEDAEKYVEEYNKNVTVNYRINCMTVSDYMYSKLEVEYGVRFGDVCHFDYDTYIGELDKPWEKNKRR